ncbi:MAG TPA: alpha-amylase family protein [Tepidisphaeraceae bacterium]|jgi:maltose alpha-D-glucosyltransferase/alpha-amylase|nr:alpha-amylase family protein [Tepidisphaeraceae bacterium]
MSTEATSDLWWKNAILYCVDTQAFLDTNGDGVGDLYGLTRRMDYLANLGVTCLWLMPIYPSPEQDHGYDVADYFNVASKYGTLGDLVELVRTARDRGIRVIADLVVNHTSSDHPWFQIARRDRDSIYHDFYVWADAKPEDADEGIIFPGQQSSTWSYDRVAKRWYMHRFYPHQPDLNINNPLVRNEIHKVIGFWLELGLSGFRVDAVPFLIEQVGAENPAVRDPHDYLRDIRSFLSRRRGDAMLLAEANEPANKLAKYFGERGEQMHMLFNFLLNQALHLALARGDARPAIKVMRKLPKIPPASQWANFVKNHDEASFDKLTDREREEVFVAFGPKKSMQLFDRGLRRRFPPMVNGDRRRMELMYSLMYSLPGTPVLFYGEEIGLGDDQRARGREAVRLPMQWSDAPGGGFTTADESSAPRRPLRDGPFGYLQVNVQAQQKDDRSFLHWTTRAIRTRKAWPEFGWGTWQVLATRRNEVMAHLSTWDGGAAMALHNFADRPVSVTLQLPRAVRQGAVWRHLFGDRRGEAPAPPSADGRLTIKLEPYGYHWFGRREGL